MNQDYWQQQTDEPLYPNLLWSRPETKLGAGKLLIIGGQAQEFLHVAEAYTAAERAGAGTIRVIMPESTRAITKMLPNIEYAEANISGSFARTALAELLDASQWADGVLLAGDLGKNSETSLLLEGFITKYEGNLVIANEALSSISMSANQLFNRKDTVLCTDLKSLQKLFVELEMQTALTSSLNNAKLAEILHEATETYPVALLLKHDKKWWNALHGSIISSSMKKEISMVAAASLSSVWYIQNPTKQLEALVTATHCY